MRILVLTLAVAALAMGGCAMSPAETARAQSDAAADRAALGQQLAGLHVTGTDDCMTNNYGNASLKAYGPTLVYTVSKSLVYVNETGGGCEGVERGDILVTKSPTGRLCRGDIGQTVSQGSRMPSGSCSLGSFTTYRK